jgi:hypothetical protein
MEEVKKESTGKKVVKVIFKVISKIISILITLLIIFEVAIGVINMNKINEEEEPVWYIDKKEEIKEDRKITNYNLGLYKIVKTEEQGKMKTVLKPFFFD